MKNFSQHISKSSLPVTPLVRKDYISAQLVEIAIVIQHLQGTATAAEYLRARKVDLGVANRVLLQPSRRRTWDALPNSPE